MYVYIYIHIYIYVYMFRSSQTALRSCFRSDIDIQLGGVVVLPKVSQLEDLAPDLGEEPDIGNLVDLVIKNGDFMVIQW